jgi:hypothetical protein
MKLSVSLHHNEISRRTMLATAAVMAASPAFAEDCQIGPPTHEKGPRVWMDLDQVELDAAYDQAFYAPLRLEILKRHVRACVQLGGLCPRTEQNQTRNTVL